MRRSFDKLSQNGLNQLSEQYCEPTASYPLIGHKGALWLDVKTRGITAHGSMPERGDNAIYKAATAIGKLRGFEFDGAPRPCGALFVLGVTARA